MVHTALSRRPGRSGEKAHALDVGATRELLLQSERHPTIRRFVYRSFGDVYRVQSSEPDLLDESYPLELEPSTGRLRDRLEADLMVTSRVGMSRLEIVVLRCAEILAEGTGSQLWDYLQSRVCLRPLGFDPMINILSVADAVRAITMALSRPVRGVFNVPGADTLPLSHVIHHFGRLDVPVPGLLLAPLYRLRKVALGMEFRYDLNMRRFHFGGVLDGTRAASALGYEPRHPLPFPAPCR